MDIKKSFGETIRALRKERKISQEGLAEKSGLHRTYIGNVERGEKNISLENIAILAIALEVEIKDLFS
ncbi:MAG: helix-turn-helix transcriptional regulator [Candidatus Gracilibacteria bacterium]